jgi:thioredoxin 1
MLSRRLLISSGLALVLGVGAWSLSASAVELAPYVASDVEKLIKSGKPVVLHVYAPWCLQCHAQASILGSLQTDARLGQIHFFRVSYDEQKDVVAQLKCPRSTVIAYKGGKEVARMSWATDDKSVIQIIDAAL